LVPPERGSLVLFGSRAVVRQSGRVVAIKKLLNSRSAKEGTDMSTLREIMLLQELKHKHVIDMIEAFTHNGSIHLVFEFCATDLEAVIKDTQHHELDAARIKGYMQGTLRGVAWIHASWVLHRDMKPGNVFLTPAGVIKVFRRRATTCLPPPPPVASTSTHDRPCHRLPQPGAPTPYALAAAALAPYGGLLAERRFCTVSH
jgi:serine/threonine protein kinase